MKNIKTMIIDGKILKVKLFKTRQAAENYINKKGSSLVHSRAHEYYVEYVG